MITRQTRIINTTPYRSYLVRFWQSNDQGCWRASAQCVQSGNTVLFGDIDHLLAFLQSEITTSRSEGATEARLLPAEQA
jgi:hypothetical protein